ncbi:MAG TPA: DUF3108 domain-containing protein, partial [Chthoniobacterales bacterium]
MIRALLLLVVVGTAGAADWNSQLTSPEAGPFPEVRPFDAKFTFGWSGIPAAAGEASLRHEGEEYQVEARGGTEGLAAQLWKIRVENRTRARRQQFISEEVRQIEQYASYRISITGKFQTDGVWRERLREPSSNPGGWKFLRVSPLRDMASAMLFVRSQPLRNGDEIRLLAFPGDSPYLVRVQIEGRESIRVMNETRPAIRLRLFLQKIETSGPNKGKLQEHAKFRSGVVWVSDDENRFPLRAEVNLFIGYVYVEVTALEF